MAIVAILVAIGFLAHTTLTRTPYDSHIMSSTISTDAAAYNDYASAAVELSQAHYSPATQVLTFTRSVRDIDNNKRRNYLYSYLKNASGYLPPVELNDRVKIRIPSPSGDKLAVFVKDSPSANSNGAADSKDPQQQVLEIWTCGGQFLEQRILLPKKLHGNVISDTAGGFGRPVWNPRETALVYAAERVVPETCSFFDDSQQQESAATGDKDTNIKVRGGQYTLGLGKTESWGEKYSKQAAHLDLFVVHTATRKIERVENVLGADDDDNRSTTFGGYTLGQAVWSPDGNSVVYVAWDAGSGQQMPRRLGLTYCMQRPSKLCRSSVSHLMERLGSSDDKLTDQASKDDPCQVLTPDIRVARSPRFSPALTDGSHHLVYLSARRPFDSHFGCFGLDAVPWKNGDPVLDASFVVVPQVWDPIDGNFGESVAGVPFPGLFTVELPENCFLSSVLLLATSQWGSCQKVVRISTSERSVKLVRAGQEIDSNALLTTVPDGSAFVSSTAPNRPSIIYHIPASSLRSEITIDTANAAILPQVLPCCASRFSVVNQLPSLGFSFDIHGLDDVPVIAGCEKELLVQSILLLPNKNQHPKPPVIVIPHGGPHSASSTTYLPSSAYLCGYGGYALLFVNYRGSVGFGQASVEALPSRCGDMDMKDVMAATEQLKKSGLVDADRIGICGGSHGGFLTAHGISQYPDYFKAAAMRNPVVNIASMITSTDIPDWCYYETLGTPYKWNEYRPPTNEELAAMYECSPVRNIQAVKAPTLVALGLSDLRVPPSQGLEWYHSLRSKGVPTKLLTYDDDDHAIAGVVSEADHWVNIKRWFDEYLK